MSWAAASRRPVGTAALALGLLAAFGLAAGSGEGAEAALEGALSRFDEVRRAHPDARLDPAQLAGAPPSLRAALQGAVGEAERAPTEADSTLARALAEARAASEALPASRFGHRSAHPTVHGVLTHALVHVRALHLIGNLLGLLLAGALLERARGTGAVLSAFVLGAAGGVLAHQLLVPASEVPLLGASAAVLGVVGALALGAKEARVGPLPAWSLAALWGLAQLGLVPLASAAPSALAAHLGGLAAGLLLGLSLRPQRPETIAAPD